MNGTFIVTAQLDVTVYIKNDDVQKKNRFVFVKVFLDRVF